ncbi:MAG: NAD(P)/FAD-dependent oxidoreductase [Oscillospiraceae bacterium]|nr:NAD(P)/FAD-dependent oxidoreductase [Oscillospiraceae bacterium]
MNKVVVIGGGAAGMMAAIHAARNGAAVTLLEPNERLGKKLNITGKGRCNVTNDSERDELIANVPRNGRFLYSAFSRWTGRDTMAFFESLGVPLKVERGKRVFPVSDRSFDVSAALERELKRLGVHIIRDRAAALSLREGGVTGVKRDGALIPADAVVIATGGVSYPATGSTGDGYLLAKQAGHTIVPPRASLVPLVCGGTECGEMQGLSLRNVTLSVRNCKGQVIFKELGELLFTHFGVSGPLVLSASAHMRDFEKDSYRLCIDLKPALDEKKLDERLLRDFSERSNQTFFNVLGGLVPHSMAPVMVRRTGIPVDTKANEITKAQRRKLLETLKAFELEVTGTRGVEEAIITSGGVKVGEVEPGTMASKLVRGLYFAGEVLDVDAYTGGFNLQIAWATGKAAGEAAASASGRNEK